mmetsp:Transcript_20267/g.29748  ORF Transcript_20267/g.29748 Transcript_20267/m.29748 type:complete len:205 (-) Transcript_20267:904-1518(-)
MAPPNMAIYQMWWPTRNQLSVVKFLVWHIQQRGVCAVVVDKFRQHACIILTRGATFLIYISANQAFEERNRHAASLGQIRKYHRTELERISRNHKLPCRLFQQWAQCSDHLRFSGFASFVNDHHVVVCLNPFVVHFGSSGHGCNHDGGILEFLERRSFKPSVPRVVDDPRVQKVFGHICDVAGEGAKSQNGVLRIMLVGIYLSE